MLAELLRGQASFAPRELLFVNALPRTSGSHQPQKMSKIRGKKKPIKTWKPSYYWNRTMRRGLDTMFENLEFDPVSISICMDDGSPFRWESMRSKGLQFSISSANFDLSHSGIWWQ